MRNRGNRWFKAKMIKIVIWTLWRFVLLLLEKSDILYEFVITVCVKYLLLQIQSKLSLFSFHPYTGWMKISQLNLPRVSLHHNTKKKILYEHMPSEARFPSYDLLTIKDNSQCPPWASTQDVARLNSDCLTRWKIPIVVRIIWNSFCVRCCRSWTSQTSVSQTVDFRSSQI
jgi:hypothetical protein